jgi:hypothetical protein
MGGYPLAGFEVTIIGRFWVTAEGRIISIVEAAEKRIADRFTVPESRHRFQIG